MNRYSVRAGIWCRLYENGRLMKKLKERYNNARFRTKLLLIFGITSLLPLLIILMISSRLNTRNMTDKVDELMIVNLRQIAERVNLNLEIYTNVLYQIYQDEEITENIKILLEDSDTGYAAAYNRINDRLKQYNTTESGVRCTSVICADGTSVVYDFGTGSSIDHLWKNYKDLLQTVTVDGRMYGIPAVCNNVALIYNREHLKEAGVEPPGNWEELKEAAARLTTEDRKGFLMSGIGGEQGAFQILPWILSTGEPADGLGGEGTAQALSFLYGLMEEGYMTHNCINLSQTDVARVFANGEASMMENGPWVFPLLEEAGIDYGVCALPTDGQNSVIVGGENLGILKGKNIEGAKLFLEYYNEDMVLRRFCEKTHSLPAKTGVRVRNQPDMQVIEEQMKGAIVRSRIPYWNTMSGELTEAFYRMTVGEITPEQAAARLRTEEEN